MSLVIVALPREDDYVNRISSEKAPHMTVLYLGESAPAEEVAKIQQFLEHAVSVWEQGPFMLDVERRGLLGADQADVLFFQKGWSLRRIEEFRGQLLKNDNIKKAFDSAQQFDGWTPHLTLGYPATPAKEDTREFPGVRWVEFDRLSLWTGDSEGAEFPLTYNYDLEEALAMSHAAGQLAVDSFLKHHGVKGMKWGVRRRDAGTRAPAPVRVSQKANKRVKAKGGKDHVAHPDAVAAAIAKRKAKSSTVDALSNKEIQDAVTRMNLEQQFGRLSKQDITGKAPVRRFIENHLKKHGKEHVSAIAAAGKIAVGV